MGDHPDQRDFELADVLLDRVGYDAKHSPRHQPRIGPDLRLEDGDAGLEVSRLDVRDQAPLKARAKPVFESGDFFWRPVGRDDDLLVELVQGIEGMKELLL